MSGDKPIAGSWDGGARSLIGVFRASDSSFSLDLNGNGAWDGTSVDRYFQVLDLPAGGNYAPVAGDWDGDGAAEVGVVDQNTGTFYYYSIEGDRVQSFQFLNVPATPVIGDWNGDGIDDAGLWDSSTGNFYLDANGSLLWDGVAGGDKQFLFGSSGQQPFSI
jgi:hypothetical protein